MKVKHVFMIAAVMLALIAAPVSAANEAILGYDVPETYTIKIPATLAFTVGNPITVKGSIAESTTLTVSVDSENDWVVKNGNDEVSYSMAVDSNSIPTENEGGAVAILTDLSSDAVANTGKISNLVFTLNSDATKAGKYTDKLTFSVEAIRPINVFKTALSTGGSVSIQDDIVNTENNLDTQLLASEDNTQIDLGSSKIIQEADYDSTLGGLSKQNCVGLLVTGKYVTLTATDGGISSALYAIVVYDEGSLTINGGTYKGQTTVVYADKGAIVTITDGFFEAEPYDDGTTADPYRYTLNLKDNTNSQIIVEGGTFVNFNPADNAAEGPNTNFVADGCTVTSEEQPNGDIWYTVVAESTSP